MVLAASGAVLLSGAGYRGLALGGAHLDALGVSFLGLGHQDQQDAVLGGGLDPVRLNVAGQGDRPAERPVPALGPVDLLPGRVARWVALPLDRHQPILAPDPHVLRPAPRYP